ncbi:MAG TPA: maltose alpha-D-glucosyltransferase [Candidatus Baltobacteraceae bacterium]|jgi:maltose alpha-D-glucosyltransferase/alpha-amylase|nr:maltose alpha-D-glucosyltransferase [Candidatus Baltobacteraceae bacterium]
MVNNTPAELQEDVDWYKDAVIYQLHVKSFCDGNGDGSGDFRGLIEKLDYLQWLGVTALWLLPFYPSPLRDDGYDVADYRDVHQHYGTMQDFRDFVTAAHARGMRVITELVLNHTSDQHFWFQRARHAPGGSEERNFYVWRDNDKGYAGTRIIFPDAETSNWAWDPVAGAYYWHRFFSHQPDLNFDNPKVLEEVSNVMRFWLEAGVDGFRLDAAAYLCEREGTSNENLPETHAVLKHLRAIMNKEYPHGFFLAEVNQWPEDVSAYFGEGDECQMAFHFPLMPRLFLSLAAHDRYPIYDIMQQMPEIPEGCQWAVFLRNHDEMTLEMVTDRERAFMYQVYALEPRAKLYVGIRRRLAPLVENDRRKIELMMSLLLSMPGTPIVYYGDEIGMGDNIFLGDRDGVRTPMQWNPDRNGGFSSADTQRLELPAIQDPVYGYQAVNVEAETRSPSSLLHSLRRLIGVRRAHRVFGRGRIIFLYPTNRSVIAYVREFQDEIVLCVVNLAETSQAATLDLSRYLGRTPVEMIGWSAFPPIVDDHYSFTLAGCAFFWFLLRADASGAAAAAATASAATVAPEFPTLVLPRGWKSLFERAARSRFESAVLPAYFGVPARNAPGSGPEIGDVHEFDARFRRNVSTQSVPEVPSPQRMLLLDAMEIAQESGNLLLAMVEWEIGGRRAIWIAALDRIDENDATAPALMRAAIARARTGSQLTIVYDALADDRFWIWLGDSLHFGREISGETGVFVFETYAALEYLNISSEPIVRSLSNEGIRGAVVHNVLFVKILQAVEPGIHPEIELAKALPEAGFFHVPSLVGSMTYRSAEAEPISLALAYRFVESRGTGGDVARFFLERLFERLRAVPTARTSSMNRGGGFVRYAQRIGRRMAEFHRALASRSNDPDFVPEIIDEFEVATEIADVSALVAPALDALDSDDALRGRSAALHAQIASLGASLTGLWRSRIHSRFDLNALLVISDEVIVSELEGDTALSFAQRRRKRSPLVDLATMLASFDALAETALAHVGADQTEDARRFEPFVDARLRRARESLLKGYEGVSGSAISRNALAFFEIERALRELTCRPRTNPPTPVPRSALRILERNVEPRNDQM